MGIFQKGHSADCLRFGDVLDRQEDQSEHWRAYNRVRTQIELEPFTLAECEVYAVERGLGFTRMHLAECYMAFGGVAYYWSLLEKGKSPEQNFNELFFGRKDGLRLEFDELYASLFNSPQPYIDIVLALGRKRAGLSRDELVAALGGESNGVLTNRLQDLEECGFIRKFLPVGGVNGGIYQLIDNFTLFYMRFVRGNTSRDGDYWTDSVSQGEKNEWRGFAFERLCLEHTAQIKRALGISGVHTDVYSWKSLVTTHGLAHNAYRHNVQSEVTLDDLFRDS